MSQTGEKKRPWWRFPAVLGGLMGLALIIASVIIFQDNITRFLINPRTPFQTMTPPPSPEYGARGAWALWPDTPGKGAVDVFYVNSTTAYSADYWNAPLSDAKAEKLLKATTAPNEVGPFFDLGAIYGPRYRQATLYSFFTHKYDGVAARQAAFADVDEAFAEFLKQSDDPERPIMLVGYGQGGLHVLGLLQRHFNEVATLRKRLAAAYVIGHAIPPEFFARSAPAMRACEGPDDFRCVISYVDLEPHYDEEMRRVRNRSMVWDASGELVPTSGEPPLCINPLSWTATEEYLAPEDHLGAASATGLQLGETPSPVARAIGAKCARGILVVDKPRQNYLRRRNWFGEKWKAQNFNLFYHDLTADAARRVGLTQTKLTEEATILAPIEGAVEIGDSPVNKVPD